MNDENLDCFDLTDWLVVHHPEVYQAVRYLHSKYIIQCAYSVWITAGKPPIQAIEE